eukprot:4999408-Pleurochrysis_carterae.AAC.3
MKSDEAKTWATRLEPRCKTSRDTASTSRSARISYRRGTPRQQGRTKLSTGCGFSAKRRMKTEGSSITRHVQSCAAINRNAKLLPPATSSRSRHLHPLLALQRSNY